MLSEEDLLGMAKCTPESRERVDKSKAAHAKALKKPDGKTRVIFKDGTSFLIAPMPWLQRASFKSTYAFRLGLCLWWHKNVFSPTSEWFTVPMDILEYLYSQKCKDGTFCWYGRDLRERLWGLRDLADAGLIERRPRSSRKSEIRLINYENEPEK